MKHLDYDNLKKLVKVADEIILFDAQELFNSKFKKPDCDLCHRMLAKHKLFDKTSRATHEGELIHINLIISLNLTIYDRCKDYILIINNYTSIVTTYFFKKKPEAALKLREYYLY